MALPSSRSAIPTPYYVIFGIIEPLLTFGGLAGTLLDPIGTFYQQEPSTPNNVPLLNFSIASRVTILQLAHVCALLGLVNLFVLYAVRTHLVSQPAVQERLVRALLTPLLLGDIMHLYVTYWALGDTRWDFKNHTPALWATLVFGIALLAPRIAWHMGVGRYVDSRDGRPFRRPPTQALKA